MPKKKYNKKVTKNTNKNKNKNKIVININSNNKKRTVNKPSSNKPSSQPYQQPFIISMPQQPQQPQQPYNINIPQQHLPQVERNNPYMTANIRDNEFGIGMSRSLNALHGSLTDIQMHQDEARQNNINLTRRYNELDNLVRNRKREQSVLDSEYSGGSVSSQFDDSSSETLSNLGSSFGGLLPHLIDASMNTETIPLIDASMNTDAILEPFNTPSQSEILDPEHNVEPLKANMEAKKDETNLEKHAEQVSGPPVKKKKKKKNDPLVNPSEAKAIMERYKDIPEVNEEIKKNNKKEYGKQSHAEFRDLIKICEELKNFTKFRNNKVDKAAMRKFISETIGINDKMGPG